MKNKVVIFKKNTAEILVNPLVVSRYKLMENALVNPDLSLVKKEPPHFWKNQNGMVVPMSRPEKLQRLQDIQNEGTEVKLLTTPLYKNYIFWLSISVLELLTIVGVYVGL